MGWFDTFAANTLIALSAVLGISDAPTTDPNWKTQGWQQEGRYQSFASSSTAIVDKCKKSPDGFIKFPFIIHGAHEIILDGKRMMTFGDPSFERTRSFFGAPVLRCDYVANAEELTWKVHSYSRYFARVTFFPKYQSHRPWTGFINETLSAVAAGALCLMAIFSFLLSFGKVDDRLVLSFCLSNLFLAGYFLFGSADFFGISISMLSAHILADLCVWAGLTLFLNTLRILELVPQKLFIAFVSIVIPATTIILFGGSGDAVQFGTSLPFGITLGALILALYFQIKKLANHDGGNRLIYLRSVGLLFWIFSVMNDILVVTGLYNGYVFLSVGCMGGLFFFGLALHERILQTYRERDYLRSNLEVEVEVKTAELKKAMSELKTTQAELIHSEKLASVGTLSAGIAHEINNSLNYVSGALTPLERLLEKEEGIKDREKYTKLFGVMNEGLQLTFEIIKSLKNYTGLNHAELKDLPVVEVVNSVLTILKSKLKGGIDVDVNIDPNLKVFGHVVGLNQVFMNLIGNAVDAMEGGGKLDISAEHKGGRIHIAVKDNGSGISEKNLKHIFEPFFTTKEVGKGTGLGMHIVKMEVERHKGQISIDSKEGEGTTVNIELPGEGFAVEHANQTKVAA